MNHLPFRIKICGVRTAADVDAVAASKADAIGLNFYQKSIRYCGFGEPERLSQQAFDAGLCRVGLFVNHSQDEILATLAKVDLDVVQLHGDESLEFATRLRDAIGKPLVRAIRLPHGATAVEQIQSAIEPWRLQEITPLFDAEAGSQFGGTGATLDWLSIGSWSGSRCLGASQHGLGGSQNNVAWVLAGGLTVENVAEAIRLSGAVAVDVASGVESVRGVKDAERIANFSAQAARGFEEASSSQK